MNEGQLVYWFQQIFLASYAGQYAAMFLARAWIFLFVPLGVWLWINGSTKEKHAVIEALWSAGLALLIGELLAVIVLRDRPFMADRSVLLLIPPPLNTSFPSLHTSIAAAMAWAVWGVHHHVRQVALLVLFGVIVGRVAVGVHYPTDILGGLAVGLVAYLLVRSGHKELRKNRPKRV